MITLNCKTCGVEFRLELRCGIGWRERSVCDQCERAAAVFGEGFDDREWYEGIEALGRIFGRWLRG